MSGQAHAAVKAAVNAVWNAEALEGRVLLSGVWEIGGGDKYAGRNEIVVRPIPTSPNWYQAMVDGVVVDKRRIRDVSGIRIWGGRGDDKISVDVGDSNAAVWIFGGSGDDTITGSAARDMIDGGWGNDKISGGGGNDRLTGGADNDSISGDIGADQLSGGQGRDTLRGGDGCDDLDGGAMVDYLHGDQGYDDLTGGEGDDRLEGGPGWDDLYGGTGNDQLAGEDGRDRLHGEEGKDTLLGGLGWDRLYGGSGADRLSGGYGQDWVHGQSGMDTIIGGSGVDVMTGGVGDDTFYRRRNDVIRVETGDSAIADPAGNPLNTMLSEDLRQRLIDAAVQRYEWYFGRTGNHWVHGTSSNLIVDFASTTVRTLALTASDSSAPVYSTTNVQEQGVDEADLIKTDGNYIYVARGNQVIVIDARNADEASEIARIDLSLGVEGIYLGGQKLTVITSGWDSTGQVTGVTVFDLSDPTNPHELERTLIDGSLSEGMTRMIGTRLYLVTDASINFPTPEWLPAEEPADSLPGEDGQAVLGHYIGGAYESEASYRARLEEMNLADLLPGYSGLVDGEEVTAGSMVDDELYVPANESGDLGLFSAVMIETGDDTPGVDDSSSVFGWSGGEMYASGNALYVAREGYSRTWNSWDSGTRTDLYKFDFTPEGVSLGATGEVAGHLLNQFSMSEYDGSFRIATTAGWASGASNNLFVLQDTGDRLDVVGEITGLAKTESIYACRFVEDRAYVVTFRKTDPLYIINLSDPTDPTVTGELKIPGFSRYLHPISGDRLIGYGRQVPDGDMYYRELQLSIFDVSDDTNPTRSGVYTLPNTGGESGWWPRNRSSSAAEYDHHAFTWLEDLQLIVIPVTDYTNDGMVNRTELVKVDANGQMHSVGRVIHDSVALRSVRIGDELYSMASDELKAVSLDDPSTVKATVDLKRPGETTYHNGYEIWGGIVVIR